MGRRKEMTLQEAMYINYIRSCGEEMLEVLSPVPPETGQVRLFTMTPPEWVLVVNKEGDLFTVIPLTTLIQLAVTDRYPPVVEWRGYRLVPLPFWVFVRKEILEKYSKPVFRVRDVDRIKEYARSARTKAIGKWREKFIKKVAERFADINLASMLYSALSAEEEGALIVQFPADLKRELEEREELARAARSVCSARGNLWLAVVEGGRLILYLDEECVGRDVRISLRDRVIFEGEGRRKVVVENFPELASCEFLEEELSVQVLQP